MRQVSDRLKAALALRDITGAELGRRCGINKGTISRYVRGEVIPKQNTIYQLSQALGVSPAFLIMLLCGLRPGECYGIQKTDIKSGVLYISRAVNNKGEITPGKNKNARRVVPLPALARDIIEQTIARNDAAGLSTPWVFCNGVGGPPIPNTARHQYNDLKAERGLPGSPYSLRHTFVSIVASQTQIPEGTIRELVGHSDSMDTFGTYKHTVDGELESAASIINLTFERLKTADQ